MKIGQIIAASVVMGIPVFMSVSCDTQCNAEYARHEATRSAIHSLYIATDVYQIECGAYPTEQEGLGALIVSPGNTNWHGPYVDGGKVPLDAWDNQFSYYISNGVPEIVSAGADRRFHTEDDVDKNSQYKSRTFGCTRF